MISWIQPLSSFWLRKPANLTEVEETLMSHPDVDAAAVVALPRSGGGEEVAAAVVLRRGAELDVEGLRQFCRTHLAAYKVPRRVFEIEELPRSLIGKVLRREVRERILSL